VKNEQIAGTTLYYKVILPKDYDAAKEYPAVIAFPGGAQTMPMVDGMIARNLKLQADKHGYIVAVLSAPAAGRFYEGGAVVFPAFLDKLLADYKVRGRKFHIAGISNGKPPDCSTPRLTSSARWRKCEWHALMSLHVLMIAMIGLPR